MVVTLQLEVVRRLMAGPGEDYGVLTLLTGLHYRVEDWFEIPPVVFPEPNVDSGCIELLRRDEPLLPPACGALASSSAAFRAPKKVDETSSTL